MDLFEQLSPRASLMILLGACTAIFLFFNTLYRRRQREMDREVAIESQRRAREFERIRRHIFSALLYMADEHETFGPVDIYQRVGHCCAACQRSVDASLAVLAELGWLEHLNYGGRYKITPQGRLYLSAFRNRPLSEHSPILPKSETLFTHATWHPYGLK